MRKQRVMKNEKGSVGFAGHSPTLESLKTGECEGRPETFMQSVVVRVGEPISDTFLKFAFPLNLSRAALQLSC